MARVKDGLAGLPRLRAIAAATILFERAWPALWPPLGLLGAFVVAALLGLPTMLPPLVQAAVLAALVAGVGVLAWRGAATIARPRATEADRRLERASGLPHRPLAALADRPATATDPALWAAHQARAGALVKRLRVGLPRPGLAMRDPRAVRGALLIGLAASLVVAGVDAPARLGRAFLPAFAESAPVPPTQVEAWATPPAYTGAAPIFLKAGIADPIALLPGTHLTISVTGGRAGDDSPAITLDGAALPTKMLDAGSAQADADLTRGGVLAVSRGGRGLASWTLAVIDAPAPTIAWAAPPGPAEQGLTTRLPWRARDGYGLASIEAELRLRDRPDAPPLLVPIPPPAGGRGLEQSGISARDLSAHPYAGLPVVARLRARNTAGRSGESDTAEFILPARAFENPVAKVLVATRRALSLHPEDRVTALAALDQLLIDGERTLAGDSGAAINLGALYSLLLRDKSDGAVPEAQARMWALALHLEDGAAERTQAAVDEARAAADAALEREQKEPSDENQTALDQALKALEQAVDEHLKTLAEQASPIPPGTRTERITRDDVRRLTEEARQAAREGRTEDAKRSLAELEKTLDRLKQASRNRKPGDAARSAKREQGQGQVGALQDMVAREGGLLDQGGQRATQPTVAADPSRQHDSRVQQALRRALGELMQQFGDLTGDVPAPLGEADQAMRDAAGALSTGQEGRAAASEKAAIVALQKGGRAMADSLDKQFGSGDPGDEGDEGDEMLGQGDGQGGDQGDSSGGSGADGRGGERAQGDQPGDQPGGARGRGGRREGRHDPRDPFGRSLGNARADHGFSEDGTQVPTEQEQMRTQEIQQELRRRGADRTRPDQERAYIDRLLRPF